MKHGIYIFGVFTSEDADIIRTVKAIREMIQEESEKLRQKSTGAETKKTKGLAGLFYTALKVFLRDDTQDVFSYGDATIYLSDEISKHVENSFRIVLNNGAIGLCLVLLVLTLFPSKAVERFYTRFELPTGSSLSATLDKIKEVEKIITELPADELESFMGYVGRTEWGTTQNSGFIGVSLTPYSTRQRNADQIIESIREKIEKVEGIQKSVFDVDTGGPDVGKPITLRVIGNDIEGEGNSQKR